MFSTLSHLWNRATRPVRAPRPSSNRRGAARPRLEALEDRCVPAVLFVTSTADNVNQVGTLRYAVAHAQNGDTIDILTASPIALTKGQLVLSHDVTIEAGGKPALISGSGISRVFEVAPAAHVKLSNLEIMNGNGTAGLATAVFPLDGDGGAILNEGTLTVSGCTLAANTAHEGGAVYNDHGTVLITASTLFRNSAKDGGGAVYNDHGSLAVSHSTLSYDFATAGGAVYNNAGGVTVADSTLTYDTARDGGGIFTDGGRVTLVRDTLSHDSAKIDGGAVYNHAGLLLVNGSTLSYDTAGIYGGGLFTDGGTADLSGDTLTHDSAGVHGGGIYHTASGALKIALSTASADTPEAEFGSYVNGGGNVGI